MPSRNLKLFCKISILWYWRLSGTFESYYVSLRIQIPNYIFYKVANQKVIKKLSKFNFEYSIIKLQAYLGYKGGFKTAKYETAH